MGRDVSSAGAADAGRTGWGEGVATGARCTAVTSTLWMASCVVSLSGLASMPPFFCEMKMPMWSPGSNPAADNALRLKLE